MALITIGAAAVLYFSVSDRVWGLKAGEDAPMAAKWVAGFVLLAWTGVLVCGRLLPYISYWMLDTELIIAAEKLISVRRGLFADPYCREPAHRLDAEEIRMVDRFLAEFEAMLPHLG